MFEFLIHSLRTVIIFSNVTGILKRYDRNIDFSAIYFYPFQGRMIVHIVKYFYNLSIKA